VAAHAGPAYGACGVTEFDGADAGLVPSALTARTVNVRATPFGSPVMSAGSSLTVQLDPPELMTHDVIVLPPSSGGENQPTRAELT
jgi:hypothetical protein